MAWSSEHGGFWLATRYRELVRAEIAETVSSPEELKAEQRDLLGSLGG